jgi:hypothetical protein
MRRQEVRMRTSFAFAACLLLSTACSAPTADDSTSTNAALPLQTPYFLCLIPDSHPWDADGEVWSVDITSGFGPPREKKLERTTGFFWGGGLTDLYEPSSSDVFWTISYTDETNGLHVYAHSDQGKVQVDLTAPPGQTMTTQGTVRVEPNVGQPQTIKIVNARQCPAATMVHSQ